MSLSAKQCDLLKLWAMTSTQSTGKQWHWMVLVPIMIQRREMLCLFSGVQLWWPSRVPVLLWYTYCPVNTVSIYTRWVCQHRLWPTYNRAVTTIYQGRLSVELLQTTASKHLQDKSEAKEWDFLWNDINTQKLFEFLSQKIVSANYPDGKDSCDRFTDGWLQYMFDPNCGHRYSCHPCWQIPL